MRVLKSGFTAVVTSVVILTAACSPPPAVALRAPASMKPHIKNARVTRRLLIDGGTLTLDPPASRPKLSESGALRIWDAAPIGGGEQVANVIVTLAHVRLHVGSTRFDALAWVVTWDEYPSGVECGLLSSPLPTFAPAAASSAPVEIFRADGVLDGVEYRSAGSEACGSTVRSSAVRALYGLSVPWSLVRREGNIVALRYTAPCGTSANFFDAGDRTGDTLTVFAAVPVGTAGCGSVRVREGAMGVRTDVLRHAPTGPVRARFTDTGGLRYFDGSKHLFN